MSESNYQVVNEETLQERRYLWTARAFSIVCAVSLCTNIIMMMALFSLVPLTRVQPFYLTFEDKKQQTVKVNPIENITKENLDLITESLIRQYVVSRLSIVDDEVEMRSRWGVNGQIEWFTDRGEFENFIQNEARPLLKRYKEEGLLREVSGVTVSPMGQEKDGYLYKVELTTTDYSPNLAKPLEQKWEIMLLVYYKDYRNASDQNLTKWEYRLKNPMGLYVKRFGQKPINDIKI